MLRYAVLAPSAHNSQPWLFEVNDDEICVYADRARSLPVADPYGRELLISCGAALQHLRLAARRFGYSETVEYLPSGVHDDLLARVHLARDGSVSPRDRRLFDVMSGRRTQRGPFEERPIDPAVLTALADQAGLEGVSLLIYNKKADRGALADLIAEGDRVQWASREFREEVARWMRPGTAARDGLPASSHRVLDFAAHFGGVVARTFDLGDATAARDRKLATGAPTLALLVTHQDAARDWIATGEALARVLLHARCEGVWSSFLNQPIEVAALRARLRDRFCISGYPQILLRLGYSSVGARPTPRRPIGDVLIGSS